LPSFTTTSFLLPGLRFSESSTAPFEYESKLTGRPSLFFDHVVSIFGSPISFVSRFSTFFLSNETLIHTLS